MMGWRFGFTLKKTSGFGSYAQWQLLLLNAANGLFILKTERKLECGPVPNVMAALPNIGGVLCSTPQSLPDTQYWNAVQ